MSDVMTVRPLLMKTDKAYRDDVSYDVTKDEILRRTSPQRRNYFLCPMSHRTCT